MGKVICAVEHESGFLCVRREGHDGDHLSIDNRKLWQGSPGAPVFWANEGLRQKAKAEVTQGMLDPTLTGSESGVMAKMKGYSGESCGECQGMSMRRNGTCLVCDTCGATTGCS